MSDDATTIARDGIIGEQNEIIADAYGALLAAKQWLPAAAHSVRTIPEINDAFVAVIAAIERIEGWRQRRDPAR